MFLRHMIFFILIFLISSCQLQTDVLSTMESASECQVDNNQISNAPCVIESNYIGKYLSKEKFSGRDILISSQTIVASTDITTDDDGNFISATVQSQIPIGWVENQEYLTLDKTTSQQLGTYNPDFIAANIKLGTSIFGTTGTFNVTQKPFCSNTNTSGDTTTVAGLIDNKCMASKGSFIYSTAYNGRGLNCNTQGNTNNQSCFVSQYSQDLFLANSASLPLSCSYAIWNSGIPSYPFYDANWSSPTFGQLRSPTIGSVVRNYCQVSNGQYFYPEAFGGRGKICAAIANPPCWLDIPGGQSRTISSSQTSVTPLCLENQTDTLPSNWTGVNDEPISKNTVRCMTNGQNRYVYTTAYDGRFRECRSDNFGRCFSSQPDISNINIIFTSSDQVTCRSNLNSCKTTCDSARLTCTGDQNRCLNVQRACYDTCYSSVTPVGYNRCMVNFCTTNRNNCNTSCNSLSGSAKTNCINTCTSNYNNCAYVENPVQNIWYLDANLRITNPVSKSLLIPNGASRSAAINMTQLLHTNVIKAGVNIFGVVGSFGGQGSWASGIHRDKSIPQLDLVEETNMYSGSSIVELPEAIDGYYGTLLPYRSVPSIDKDNEGSVQDQNINTTVDRTTWGSVTCGIAISQNTIDKKISDCSIKFGSTATWDGSTSGNASQGRWVLVTRKLNSSTGTFVEVWRDERTNMLWSSLISESTNWCKASGSSNNPGVAARYRENDPSNICNNGAYQQQTGNVISACVEGTGFTDVDSTFNIDGKADLKFNSTPVKVHWRIPTLYDYEVAEYNGIRFVLGDIGLQRSSPLVEWTGTINSQNRDEAWAINTVDGSHRAINRSDSAGVRCIGR